MSEKKTYFLVKVCKAHKGCHGWTAMDEGENVEWLPEWLEDAMTENFTIHFMSEAPDRCLKCKSNKEKAHEY